jgi:hypothetical protein
MQAALEARARADQFQIRLMHQRRPLERMIAPLGRHQLAGAGAQLCVYQRKQLGGSVSFAVVDCCKQTGDLLPSLRHGARDILTTSAEVGKFFLILM